MLSQQIHAPIPPISRATIACHQFNAVTERKHTLKRTRVANHADKLRANGDKTENISLIVFMGESGVHGP